MSSKQKHRQNNNNNSNTESNMTNILYENEYVHIGNDEVCTTWNVIFIHLHINNI
jgi:hypothetical protein